MYIVTYEYNALDRWEKKYLQFKTVTAVINNIQEKLENPHLFQNITINYIEEGK